MGRSSAPTRRCTSATELSPSIRSSLHYGGKSYRKDHKHAEPPGRCAVTTAAIALAAYTGGTWVAHRNTSVECANAFGGCARTSVLGACLECADLHSAAAWKSLNTSARAELFVAAAKSGLLTPGLKSCAERMTPNNFWHDGAPLRGVAAAVDLDEGVVCTIGDLDLISVATVRSMLGPEFIGLQKVHGDAAGAKISGSEQESLSRKASDDRALLAVLLLRERARAKSVLAPYIHSCLTLPENVPAGWDPKSGYGSHRRAVLLPDPRLLAKTDMLRALIAEKYAALVPAALARLPHVLAEGLPCDDRGCDSRELSNMYSLEHFTEVWLAITSRDFVNSLQARSSTPLDRGMPFPSTFLVPLVDLMNHDQSRPIDVVYDVYRRGFVVRARRRVRRGEELLVSYGTQLCRETSISRYGFTEKQMGPCPS